MGKQDEREYLPRIHHKLVAVVTSKGYMLKVGDPLQGLPPQLMAQMVGVSAAPVITTLTWDMGKGLISIYTEDNQMFQVFDSVYITHYVEDESVE